MNAPEFKVEKSKGTSPTKRVLIIVGIIFAAVIIFFAMILAPTFYSTKSPIVKETSSATETTALTKTYQDKHNKYSIKYPEKWEYETGEKGMIIFSGKKGTPAYLNMVDIQPIFTKKTGGNYANVDEMMVDFKKEMPEHHGKILEEKEIELPQNGNLKGKSILFTYEHKGKMIKQWQVVVMREDGELIYMWGYLAPEERYEQALPIGKAMLDSWVIEK